jgi:hypothetical protein
MRRLAGLALAALLCSCQPKAETYDAKFPAEHAPSAGDIVSFQGEPVGTVVRTAILRDDPSITIGRMQLSLPEPLRLDATARLVSDLRGGREVVLRQGSSATLLRPTGQTLNHIPIIHNVDAP